MSIIICRLLMLTFDAARSRCAVLRPPNEFSFKPHQTRTFAEPCPSQAFLQSIGCNPKRKLCNRLVKLRRPDTCSTQKLPRNITSAPSLLASLCELFFDPATCVQLVWRKLQFVWQRPRPARISPTAEIRLYMTCLLLFDTITPRWNSMGMSSPATLSISDAQMVHLIQYMVLKCIKRVFNSQTRLEIGNAWKHI